jgi:hypothetical protein
MLAHAPVGETLARRTAIVKNAAQRAGWDREGLAAHREYERLISKGMRHDHALRGDALWNESLLGSVRPENIDSICVSHSDGHRRRVD